MFWRRTEIVRKFGGNKHERIYLLDSPRFREYPSKTSVVSTRRFLTAEQKLLEIKREKNEQKNIWKYVPLWKGTRSSRSVNNNVTQLRKGRRRWPTGDWRDILDFARYASDDAIPDDDDGNYKVQKMSNSRGLNVTLNSLQTC
jgi:hypothetical protein